MSEEILINITPMESRVAVVENGVLQEVHVERTQKRGIVGNIYKGKVVRVLPGMQAPSSTSAWTVQRLSMPRISLREGPAVEASARWCTRARAWWCKSPRTLSVPRAPA